MAVSEVIDYEEIINQQHVLPKDISSIISGFLDPPLPQYKFNFDPYINLLALSSREDQRSFIQKLVHQARRDHPSSIIYVFTDDNTLINLIPIECIVIEVDMGVIETYFLKTFHDITCCVTPTPYYIYIFDKPDKMKQQIIRRYKKQIIEKKMPIFTVTNTIKQNLSWISPITYVRVIKNKDDLDSFYKSRIKKRLLERAKDPNDFFLVEIFPDNLYFIPRKSIEGCLV